MIHYRSRFLRNGCCVQALPARSSDVPTRRIWKGRTEIADDATATNLTTAAFGNEFSFRFSGRVCELTDCPGPSSRPPESGCSRGAPASSAKRIPDRTRRRCTCNGRESVRSGRSPGESRTLPTYLNGLFPAWERTWRSSHEREQDFWSKTLHPTQRQTNFSPDTCVRTWAL